MQQADSDLVDCRTNTFHAWLLATCSPRHASVLTVTFCLVSRLPVSPLTLLAAVVDGLTARTALQFNFSLKIKDSAHFALLGCNFNAHLSEWNFEATLAA